METTELMNNEEVIEATEELPAVVEESSEIAETQELRIGTVLAVGAGIGIAVVKLTEHVLIPCGKKLWKKIKTAKANKKPKITVVEDEENLEEVTD